MGSSTIAVMGAGGRTGARVVRLALARGLAVRGLYRSPPSEAPASLVVVCGDVTEPDVLQRLIVGCDAVVCALGPDRHSPVDLSSRVGRSLLAACREAGVRRVALVAGAMSADESRLGGFYRRAIRSRWVQPLLADRRLQERELLASGLDVTILRPPRLSHARSTGPLLERAPVVQLLDFCSRDDLAEVLLAAVEGDSTGELHVRSTPTWTRFLALWIGLCGVAEFAAIGLAAALAVVVSTAGGPSTGWALATVLAFIGLGLVEGAMIGGVQGWLIAHRVRNLSVRTFAVRTMLVAASAWALGMAPSLLFPAEEAAQATWEPSWVTLAALAGAGGALAGLALGAAQASALRAHVDRIAPWVVATTAGWALALPIEVVGASSLPSEASTARIVLSGLVLGLTSGVVFALPTGIVAWRQVTRLPTTAGR